MSYIESQLLPGERVQYGAHLHRVIFLPAYFFSLLAILLLLGALGGANPSGFFIFAVAAIIAFAWAQVIYSTSEFAVTNKRVVIKVGWLNRRTVETMLSKVEGIGVDQSILGRLLNYGSIVVTGTGGTQERFKNISDPFEFRRQVQAQVSYSEDRRLGDSAGSPVAAVAAQARDERDCPYCAERVLVRARVCKHCGRDIEPLRT